MEKKSDIVRKLVSCGDYKKALKIAKDFKLGISEEDANKMRLAYECMVHERFYRQLGKDIELSISEGIQFLNSRYGQEV